MRNFWPLIYVNDTLYWIVGLRKSDEAIKNEKKYKSNILVASVERVHLKISKELISESEIQSKINEIGDQINEDYDGQDLLIIGILKGAFITISDLAKGSK